MKQFLICAFLALLAVPSFAAGTSVGDPTQLHFMPDGIVLFNAGEVTGAPACSQAPRWAIDAKTETGKVQVAVLLSIYPVWGGPIRVFGSGTCDPNWATEYVGYFHTDVEGSGDYLPPIPSPHSSSGGPIQRLHVMTDGVVLFTAGEVTGAAACSQHPRWAIDPRTAVGKLQLDGLLAARAAEARIRVFGSGACDPNWGSEWVLYFYTAATDPFDLFYQRPPIPAPGSSASFGNIGYLHFMPDGIVLFSAGPIADAASCSQSPRWAIDAKTTAGRVQLDGLLAAYRWRRDDARVRVFGSGQCDPNWATELVSHFYTEPEWETASPQSLSTHFMPDAIVLFSDGTSGTAACATNPLWAIDAKTDAGKLQVSGLLAAKVPAYATFWGVRSVGSGSCDPDWGTEYVYYLHTEGEYTYSGAATPHPGGGASFGNPKNVHFMPDRTVLFSTGPVTGAPPCSQAPRWAIDAKTESGSAQVNGLLAAYQRGAYLRVHGSGACDPTWASETVFYFHTESNSLYEH